MKIITSFIFLFLWLPLWGQDNIIQNDGSEIKAQVTKITPKTILYKPFDNINGPTHSIPKSRVFMIQYENGHRVLLLPPKDTSPANLEAPIIQNYIFLSGAIGIGFSKLASQQLNNATYYTNIGYKVGYFYEMGNVVYFFPKKMPKNIGLGLNFTWLSVGITDAYPYIHLFPHTGGAGPQISFKLGKKSYFDLHIKPSISVVPINHTFKPAFLMDIGGSFRYKAFTIGLSGAILPVLCGNYYNLEDNTLSRNIPHRYSHIKLRISASIQNNL